MASVAALFCILAAVHLVVHNAASMPAPWPNHSQEGFVQEIQQVSEAVAESLTAGGSRQKRSSGVSSSGLNTSSPVDTALCRRLIANMKRFWQLCDGNAAPACRAGPPHAIAALQPQGCAIVLEGQDLDDLLIYAGRLLNLPNAIRTTTWSWQRSTDIWDVTTTTEGYYYP